MADGPILLTGVHGQVGGDLLAMLQPFGPVVAPERGELDLADGESVRRYVRALQPRWIVNPAAYTAVDKAETEAELAFRINAEAPRIFGEEAARIGAAVLHFSTDYVFAGEGERPWREDDPTGPLGVYGTSKLAGERALAASGAAHLIFRTSWVYGTRGKNFLLSILRMARQKDVLRIVADQHGAPTWSRDLARMVAQVLRQIEGVAGEQGVELEAALSPISGVYHACGAGETTWFGFAREFLRVAREKEPEERFATLEPIATTQYPTPAKRPANSRMDCSKLKARLGYEMPRWQDSTAQVIDEVVPVLAGTGSAS